jgi:hypothetical protein
MRVDLRTKAQRRISGWVFVAPSLAAVVIGYVAVGPISLVVAALAAALMLVAAFSGPRINRRVYGQTPTRGAWSASAIHEHVAGQVELHGDELRWRARRADQRHPHVDITMSTVSDVTIEPLPGIPTSCRVTFLSSDGSTVALTVFARPDILKRAFEARP